MYRPIITLWGSTVVRNVTVVIVSVTPDFVWLQPLTPCAIELKVDTGNAKKCKIRPAEPAWHRGEIYRSDVPYFWTREGSLTVA